MKLILSNQFDILFKEWADQIIKSSPFEKHWVFVPSFATEYWLKKSLARYQGIYMGVNFSFLLPGIKKLVSTLYSNVNFSSQISLSLSLQDSIYKILETYHSMSLSSQKIYETLYSYFEGKVEANERKITSLADYLATLFLKYALYAPSLKQDWEEGPLTNWQQALWLEVTKEKCFLTHPREVLSQEPLEKTSKVHVHLFGFNFIPQLYFEILSQLEQKVEIEIYQLSPSHLFWSDIRSPSEKASLMSWLKKKGAKTAEVEDLSSYLSDTNPLLSLLGRVGRSWFEVLEESGAIQSLELYSFPEKALKLSQYSTYCNAEEHQVASQSMTLLKYIQMDIFTLRKPKEFISLPKDTSIEVHQVTTYQREIEVLYHSLINLFSKKEDLSPDDVVILVPNIEHYIPYIETLFKQTTSPFEICLHDYPYSQKNKLLKGFEQLMALLQNRWETNTIFAFFEHPLVKEKFNLASDDIDKWKKWVDEAQVEWGVDSSHQTKILEQEYPNVNTLKHTTRSWADFFDYLIQKLATYSNEEPFEYHLNQVDFSSTPSLNTLAELLSKLQKNLVPFQGCQKATFEDWAHRLIELVHTYFGDEFDPSKESLVLIQRIRQVGNVSEDHKQGLYPFESFWYYLQKDLSVFHTEIQGQQMEAISFYSLYSRPIRPAKVICILGLSDDSFPRTPIENPLSKLKDFSEIYYAPSHLDQDRYQFLETLLLTGEKLFLSYLSLSTQTQKEQQPSSFITELLNYVDRYYLMDEQPPSSLIKKIEPHLKFDKSYFMQENNYQNTFELAKNYYLTTKKKAYSRLSRSFSEQDTLETNLKWFLDHKTLSIQKLNSFIRDPIQKGLNNQHQIYIQDTRWENKDQKYSLTAIQRAILRKKEFKQELLSSNLPSLPKGIFKNVALEQLQEEQEVYNLEMNKLGIDPKELLFLELREDIKEPKQFNATHWLLPPIKIEFGPFHSIQIVGNLDLISTKGIVSLAQSNFENTWCLWPSLLILSLLPPFLGKEIETKIHFLKSQKTLDYSLSNPLSELRNFVLFYLYGHQFLLPFLPNWLTGFTMKGSELLKAQIKNDLQSDYFNSPYTKTLIGQTEFPKDEKIRSWQNLAQELFIESFKSMQVVRK